MRRKLENCRSKEAEAHYQFGEAECIGGKRRWASGAIHAQRFVQTFRIGSRRAHEASVIHTAHIVAQICVACVACRITGQIAGALVRCTQGTQASAPLQCNWNSIFIVPQFNEIPLSCSRFEIFTLIEYGHTASAAGYTVVLHRRSETVFAFTLEAFQIRCWNMFKDQTHNLWILSSPFEGGNV